MNEVTSILLEQRRTAEQQRKTAESARHASGLYAAGNGWFSRALEFEHVSPLGLSATKLVSPEQVCERYRRQYGKALTVDQLKAWANAGNFPLPRSINGVIGWTAESLTPALNALSRSGAGRGFTSISRAGSL
ncbi:TPA: hypothetical protein ACQJIL_001093 [Citrobacter freundii]|uniref:hypothetical protein n=1 Tax=Escherichia coli TaxID=562 RepID=UPI000BE5FEAE|nr:hypothetical protein [Escherichia coli]HEE9982812.1 hypothetical protein [Citrobacter freundii]